MIETNSFFTDHGAEESSSSPHQQASGQLSRHDFLFISAALNRIAASTAPAEFLPEFLQTAIEIVKGDSGYLLSCTAEKDWQIKAALRRDGILFAPCSDGIDHAVVERVVRNGKPEISRFIQKPESGSSDTLRSQSPERTLLCVPLRSNNDVVGAVYIDRTPDQGGYADHELQMLTTLAELAVVIRAHVAPQDQLSVAGLPENASQEEVRLRQLYGSFIDSIPAPLLIINRKGEAVLCNRSYRNHSLFTATDKQQEWLQICSSLEGDSAEEYRPTEVEFAGHHFRLSSFPTTADFRGIIIHELAQRCQNCRSQESNSFSEVTGSVAHEIKNALAPAMGRLQLLQHTLAALSGETNDPADRQIEIIQKQLDLIASIVDNLADLSRPRPLETRFINLPDLMEGTLEAIRITDGQVTNFTRTDSEDSDFFLLTSYANNLPAVAGDSEQLQQLFSNLIINAVHAVEVKKGGAISIQVNPLESSEIEVVIADTGVGMDVQMQERIWEPWFTTRAGQGGSGLGMMIIKTIVDAHGGRIRVQSWPGSGTRIHIMLPVAADLQLRNSCSAISPLP